MVQVGSRQGGPLLRRRLLVAVVLLYATAASAQVVRVYGVKHRTAEELAPLVASAVGDDARVITDRRTNQLVLSGSPRAVESALALLTTLDVRTRMVRLHYEARRADELASGGVSIAWRAAGGALRIGEVSWPNGAAALAIGAETDASRRTGKLAGELSILEGRSGRIASGMSLPITSRRIQRGARGESVEESTHFVTAESGFEATPRVLGDGRVELALRPFDASVRRDGAIERTGADTVVVLAPGATVALGGIVREESQRHGSFSSAGGSGVSQESLLLVTVEVE
jgi:Bacterial type II and III secretion system protein/Bacterial type II/III secretion system short domain